MKRERHFLAIAAIIFCLRAFPQQDPQFTQFMHSKLIYNPAYAGTSKATCLNAMYRQQWVSFPGAPKTGLFSFDMYNEALGGIGIGLNLMNDQLGADKTWYARGAFSKHFYPTDNLIFSIGIDAGVLQKQISGNWVAPQTLYDPSIPNNAGGTGAPALNKLVPDFGGGLFCTVPGKFYAGLSASHLSAAELKGASGSNYKLGFQMARHYYLVAGYSFFPVGPDHAFTPNIKVKSDGTSTQLDINITYEYRNMFWFGTSWRMQDAIAPMLGIKRGNCKMGYSYDATTSRIRGYSSGTHEIFFSLCCGYKKREKKESHQVDRYFD